MTTPLEFSNMLGLTMNPSTFEAYLANWEKVQAAQKYLVSLEMTMRKALFAGCFPNPVEGVNSFDLTDGRTIKGTFKITRTLDEAMIPVARQEFFAINVKPPVEFDDLLKTSFSVVSSAYKKLDPTSAHFLAVARMITAKPGAPTLEVK